jgi:hypothetical protein
MGGSSFRFLDLPAELRLAVYSFIPVTTKYHTLEDQLCRDCIFSSTSPSTFTLVAKTASVALLVTMPLDQLEVHAHHRKDPGYIVP